jgi:imidazolonepropionase
MTERFVVTADRVCPAGGRSGSARSHAGIAPAIEDGAVLVECGKIAAIGSRREVIERANGALVIANASLITPGLVDAHTHSAWVGSRHDEYSVRLAGGDYEAIARAGGGIVSTMAAVRASSTEEITTALRSRLRRMASLGVTTVEVKSGYGLDEPGERKLLEAIADAARDPSLPRVVATYLALHAIPPDRRADRAAYVDDVAKRWLPAISNAGLARFVDVYVDRSAFTVDEGQTVFRAARDHGLGVRIHAGQFADVGAVEMACTHGAYSADHLEFVSRSALDAMAAAGTAAILLPTASWTLGQLPPPVEMMRQAGVTLVVASDANPGTAPTESLPLAMAMGALNYGMTAEESLLAATIHAARSLALEDTGALYEGASADLVLWNLPHERSLIQPWGVTQAAIVIGRGNVLYRHVETAAS